MIKTFILFLPISCSFPVFSQKLDNHEKKRLDKFNINPDSLDPILELDVLNLRALIKGDLQHRRRKRAGFIFAGAGLLLTTLGIVGIANNDAEGIGGAVGDLMGAGAIVMGADSAGVSIPFFNSAKKRKRQRDVLIEKIRMGQR